jgi:transposase-like protein
MQTLKLAAVLVVSVLLSIVALPALALFWLSCRLSARPCPRCGARWWCELTGVWDGVEDWLCHSCQMRWSLPCGGSSRAESD